MSLFRTKPIDVNADTGLKRCLGAFDLTMLGIGCIIGTGIFVLTGVVSAQHAGPAIVLSFVISGIACAFAALSYAELAGAIGGAGSAFGTKALRLASIALRDGVLAAGFRMARDFAGLLREALFGAATLVVFD
jgi:amino acid permease